MKRICIVCGKDAEVGNFCKDCFISKHKLFEIKDFSIIICRNNDMYYFRKWKDFLNTKQMIQEFVSNEIKRFGKIEKILTLFRPFKDGYKVDVKCIGKISNIRKAEEKQIHISIKKKMCDDCIKLSGRYHEARFQIRGEYFDKIMDKVSKLLPKTCWIEKNKYGYDIFFTNKQEAGELASYLKKKHEVKKSFKVVGSKKGKMLNRDFYAIR